MSLSPAQRHSARINAERRLNQQKALSSDTSLHVQLAALQKDIDEAAKIEQRPERTRFKRDVLLPRWMPSAESWLSGGETYQNPIFVWCVIWLFDAGELDLALEWAELAIERGQEAPAPFRSSLPVFVADTVLAWAETESANGAAIEPYFSRTMGNVLQCWQVHGEQKAKYLKLAGRNLLRDENGEPRAAAIDDRDILLQAKDLLEQAKGFDSQCGVGTDLQKIAQRLRALDKPVKGN